MYEISAVLKNKNLLFRLVIRYTTVTASTCMFMIYRTSIILLHCLYCTWCTVDSFITLTSFSKI